MSMRSALLVLVLLAVACAGTNEETTGGRDEPAAPRVEQARIVSTPGVAAFYGVVDAPAGARLVRVEAPAASVDLHATVEEDGVVRMVARPDGFEVPASGRLELAPGGAHAMLIDPEPFDGETVAVTLHFDLVDGTSRAVPVDAAIERLGGSSSSDAGSGHDEAGHDGSGDEEVTP